MKGLEVTFIVSDVHQYNHAINQCLKLIFQLIKNARFAWTKKNFTHRFDLIEYAQEGP